MPSPEFGSPEAHGTLREHGSLPKLNENTPSFQRLRNDREPVYVLNVIHPARAEMARQAISETLDDLEDSVRAHKPDARELLTEEPVYRAAIHNELKPTDVPEVHGIDKYLDDLLRNNGRVVVIGG